MVAQIKVGLCKGCGHDQCQVKAVLEDDVLVETINFPESPFTPEWTTEGCPKQRAMVELQYHKDRLNYPLKRKGARGEGKWERIEWEQALDEIAAKLKQIKEESGAESVGGLIGFWNEEWDIGRFFNLFGSPNVENINARICSGVEAFTNTVMFGGITHYGPPDPKKCKCFVMWSGEHWTTSGIKWANEKPVPKKIVVNSTGSLEARRADIWLQPRPGTDAALGFGWLKVIIDENLYDKEFVEKWCHGFDQLKKRVSEWPLDKVEQVTWVPRQKIIDAATMYATNKPASINWGTACGHIGRNAAQSERVRCALRAITGNVGVIGGNHFIRPHPKLHPFITLLMDDKMPEEQMKKAFGSDRYRVMSWQGWSKLVDKKSQRAFAIRGPAYPALINAMDTGVPYKIRALFIEGCNPLLTVSNAKRLYNVMKNKIEMNVALEMFMTPTSMLCDYVLPVTSWMERSTINFLEHASSIVVGQRLLPKSAPGKYDRRDDYDFWRGLGIRFGQAEHWPWKDLDDVHDFRLRDFPREGKMGWRLDEFASQKGFDFGPPDEKPYLREGGFRTPTGKIELASTIYEELGYDPVPWYEEPGESPISTPELAKEYPYILMNNPKSKYYMHSQYRHSNALRRRHPEPITKIHPDTAKKLGINEGDMVWIETKRGKIKQKAKVTNDVMPQVIACDFGWWFPEKPAAEPSLYGVWEANFNVLTSDDMDHADVACGSWYLEGLLCKIYKAT